MCQKVKKGIKMFLIVAGCSFHQPSQCGVCLHAGARPGGWRHRVRAGPPSSGPDLSLPVLLLHGQRDLLPPEALPRRGLQRPLLGPVSRDCEPTIQQYAPNQRGARLLHRDLHRVESVWGWWNGSNAASTSCTHAASHCRLSGGNYGSLTYGRHRREAYLSRQTRCRGLSSSGRVQFETYSLM